MADLKVPEGRLLPQAPVTAVGLASSSSAGQWSALAARAPPPSPRGSSPRPGLGSLRGLLSPGPGLSSGSSQAGRPACASLGGVGGVGLTWCRHRLSGPCFLGGPGTAPRAERSEAEGRAAGGRCQAAVQPVPRPGSPPGRRAACPLFLRARNAVSCSECVFFGSKHSAAFLALLEIFPCKL